MSRAEARMYMAAAAAFLLGALLALSPIQHGGKGQVIDVALYESVFNVTESLLPEFAAQGVIRERSGSTLPPCAMARIAAIEHPNILPTYVSAPIADNYLFVTPRMGMTLLEAISKHNLTPRSRTKLLVQALEGLSTLHAARLIHRDFTLRNILVDQGANVAYLFDFDLAMSLDDVGNQTFRNYYKGRIFGSPGWSVAPETIDQALMDTNITTSLDIYAIGGALHGLFTEQLLYGPADDMWALLIRIAEGVVIAVTPGEGTDVARGSTVTITVSTGPDTGVDPGAGTTGTPAASNRLSFSSRAVVWFR